MDFEGELITEVHEEHEIPCARCHGPSVLHMHDETLMTTPDVLYGRAQVVDLCKECHDEGHGDPEAVRSWLDEWRGKSRPNGRGIRDDSICTDCHGKHTIIRAKAL